ncbi:MAG: D-alanyl-D-alanine carboxypeptidase [Clostridia bacterium]|nr:D-alanyl-D-alanine carboxypeptidase [Clostridia bacterium]
MKKRIIKVAIYLLIFILSFINYSISYNIEENTDYSVEEIIQTVSNSTDDLQISSGYAIAFDRGSKSVILGKNENKQVPMASTTKIMTAIVLLEHCEDLSVKVEVCKEAASIGGSRLGLKTNDKITMNDLLYGLMLCSGNDAATQIAVSVGGSVEKFAKMMNAKAKELNLSHTHFTSPHGLDNPMHYTTAYELAIITDYALNIEKIAEVVNTKNYTVTINGYSKNITNTHELLGYLEGVNGVKTGFTNGAGRCLVTSVDRSGFNIIVVVLGANTKKIRTKDSIKIINYIYENYELVNIEEKILESYDKWKQINEKRIVVNKGVRDNIETILGNIKIKFYPIKKDEIKNLNIQIENIDYLEAPVEKKLKIGEINISLGEKEIQNISIHNNSSIDKKSIYDYLKEFGEVIKLPLKYNLNM